MTKQAKAEQQEAIEKLREILKPGDTVHTVLRNVSRSGMSRQIDLYKIDGAEMSYLTGYAAKALDYRRTEQGALKVGGCGMDMGFAVVYNLSRRLFPDGFIPAKAGRTFGRNGSPATALDNDGGYALNQRWV